MTIVIPEWIIWAVISYLVIVRIPLLIWSIWLNQTLLRETKKNNRLRELCLVPEQVDIKDKMAKWKAEQEREMAGGRAKT